MRNPKGTPLLINASHPFPLKRRCAHCSSTKLSYYTDYTNPYWYPNTKYARDRGLRSFEGWMEGCQFDYYLPYHKRNGFRMDPQHSVAFKRYNPKLTRSWSNSSPSRHYVSNMTVVVVCGECGLQSWVYMNSTQRLMPENANRKARFNCPGKIMPIQIKSKRR